MRLVAPPPSLLQPRTFANSAAVGTAPTPLAAPTLPVLGAWWPPTSISGCLGMWITLCTTLLAAVAPALGSSRVPMPVGRGGPPPGARLVEADAEGPEPLPPAALFEAPAQRRWAGVLEGAGVGGILAWNGLCGDVGVDGH